MGRIPADFQGSFAPTSRFKTSVRPSKPAIVVPSYYRECRGSPGPKCRKSLKKGRRGPCRPGVPKKCRKSRKSHEKVPKRDFFRHFFRLFRHFFWHSGPTGPGTTFFETFSAFWAPEGPGTTCNWALQSQLKALERRGYISADIHQEPKKEPPKPKKSHEQCQRILLNNSKGFPVITQ